MLDGAKALAVPTKYGQSLEVEKNNTNNIVWKSYNELNEIWFEDIFSIAQNEITKQTNSSNSVTDRLVQIINAAQALNPNFLKTDQGYTITTRQDFNRLWGLGTSSTLINNMANWANVDAYTLLEKTFGGSGYDIACAQHDTPVIYQLSNTKDAKVETVNFKPTFSKQLYFVYLNNKQNSRDSIKAYKALGSISQATIETINHITETLVNCPTLSHFTELINKHEKVISELINQETIKSKYFKDFKGSLKSLGGWGGDFVLAISESNPTEYFISKGFNTVIPYNKMVLN